jgi:flagellum-specific ATP synthase
MHDFGQAVNQLLPQLKTRTPDRCGTLVRLVGLRLEARGIMAPVGASCMITGTEGQEVEAEVVGFHDQTLYLMPLTEPTGIGPGSTVRLAQDLGTAGLGPQLLGRVIDGRGEPLDGRPRPEYETRLSLQGLPVNPMERGPIDTILDVGVKAINGVLTLGRGQRIGLVAGSGVGKSVLLSMLTRNCVADVIVIALVGERSREVREFCDDQLDDVSRSRAVVVASPADTSPLARAKGAEYATDVATWFRDQGKHVVLIVDSLTRYAMAQREIGLSLGEAPVARGYPASVFGKLPALVEKVGNGEHPEGSLTAFYTVLLEGDDVHDPVADAARGVLDGHIFLSRELADSGHYPAIDIEKSISRVMPKVASQDHVLAARRIKQLISRHERSRDMVAMGAYMQGSDPDLDAALRLWPHIQTFLQQESHQVADLEGRVTALSSIARASKI